jgi:hypothetical protein
MRLLSACKVMSIAAVVSSAAVAQTTSNPSQRSLVGANRFNVDAAFTRVWLHNSSQSADYPLHAATGRVGMRLGTPALTEDAPWQDKLAVGVFWSTAPDQRVQSGRIGFQHVGAFAEYMPIGITGLGFFEPMLSMSVGRFRPEVIERKNWMPTPILNTPQPGTHLSLTPALGTRVWLSRNLGLRLDGHDLIIQSGKTWFHDFGLSAGLTARF